MRKTKTLLVLTFLMFTLGVIMNKVHAQTPNEHLITINTQYMLPGDSTARANFRALMKEYFDKVTMKNQYVLHERTMGHYYTDDSRELVTVTEYATWADIDKANDRYTELEKEAWPDAKQRQDFMKKLAQYTSSHKDAIYHALPGMNK